MNGMPSAAVISFSVPATSICNCSDSTTQGPAIRKKGWSSPTSKPHSFMRPTFSLRAAWCASAAWMKDLNSGWPPQGVDLNSGWNCTPMNHGCTLCGSSTISVSFSRCVSAEITSPASVSRSR